MKKALSLLALAFPCLSQASSPLPIEQYKDITFRQFATISFAVDNLNKILQENFPLYMASEDDIKAELRYVYRFCRGENIDDRESPKTINGIPIEYITCNEKLGSFMERLEREAKNFNSMSFKQYRSMNVKEFSQIPKINLAEFLNYVKTEYGYQVRNSFYVFYHNMARLCNNDPALQVATPKQRKEIQAICKRGIDSLLKEYE